MLEDSVRRHTESIEERLSRQRILTTRLAIRGIGMGKMYCIQSTYDILVGIHEYVEAVFLRYAEDGQGVLDPLLIVLSGASMLDCLPRKDVSDGVVAHLPQPGEVGAGGVKGEGSADEGHVVSIVEVVGNMGRLIGSGGEFGVASDINTVKSDLTVAWIPECPTVDAQAKWSHGNGMLGEMFGKGKGRRRKQVRSRK